MNHREQAKYWWNTLLPQEKLFQGIYYSKLTSGTIRKPESLDISEIVYLFDEYNRNISYIITELAELAEKAKNKELKELTVDKTSEESIKAIYTNIKKLHEKHFKTVIELSRKFKLTKKYQLTDIPEYADHMTMTKFIDCVESGGFINSDGFGKYATETEESNIEVSPSTITSGIYRKDFKYITWYNK